MCNPQELALRWSIARAPRRSEQQALGAFHLAAHFIGTGQLRDAKEVTKTLRKVAPRSESGKELSALVITTLGEEPEIELRIDASDGNPYPFSSFQEVYGPQVCKTLGLSLHPYALRLGYCRFASHCIRMLCMLACAQAEEYWAIAEPAPPQ